MHAPQSPRPRTYLQRHGIKIIGVILVLGFLNALQPFDSYVIALWEDGREVWQMYKHGEGEIEERASARRRAQEILAICGQYCHPAMKELEQGLFEFGNKRGELDLGEYPDLSPFGQFSQGYEYFNSWRRETRVESLDDYWHLNRCLNSASSTTVSHLHFECIKYFFDADPHQFRTGGYSLSIQGFGNQYQESMSFEMNLFNGESLAFHKDTVNLLSNLQRQNRSDSTFHDGSFVITLQGNVKNLILESNSESREFTSKLLSDLLDRCYSTAVEANLTGPSIFNRIDSKTTDHFNYTDASLAKLSNTELKLIHQDTLKDLQEIKKYYLLTCRRIDAEIKELLDNTKSAREKLQNATPDAP